MISTDELKKIFNDKLAKTGSLDAAFTKATWVAYKNGISDAKNNVTNEEWSDLYTQIYSPYIKYYYHMSIHDYPEAEILINELRDIINKLHQITVNYNIHSGIGFKNE